MTLAYFDCFSGISGDMTLGALVDAGLSIERLRSELAKLNLSGYAITSEPVRRSGLAATKVRVVLDEAEQPARRLADIRKIIDDSTLSPAVKEKSLGIFQRLAEAEATVHGCAPEEVHFHEVGAVDALVDIVGSVIGLELLGITRVIASAINLGSGSVRTAHGALPVPSPAAVELLKGVPVYSSSIAFELTTPTGAAIISTLGMSFGPLPPTKISRIAYGAGDEDFSGRANVLRLMIGEPGAAYEEDSSVVIETNIDDMNPQVYEYLIESLMSAGAQDAYLTPIVMKKGRPAVLLSVLADHGLLDAMLDIIFRETTSIGVRIHEVGRKKLRRLVRDIETRYGAVRVKISETGNGALTVSPEYEDCKRAAEQNRVPLKEVMEEARRAFEKRPAARGGA